MSFPLFRDEGSLLEEGGEQEKIYLSNGLEKKYWVNNNIFNWLQSKYIDSRR